jgi:glycosyltransferase involved in cell wall biosynthesis
MSGSHAAQTSRARFILRSTLHFFFRRPAVSVVLAAYNHETFVAKAVSTVLDQTFGDLELIVVDDGSSDSTPDVVASIKDPRIKLIRLPANRAVHPRNLALTHARGRYIAFQNSDDEWQPTKLALQVRAMERDSSLSACFTAGELIDETGQPATGTWADGVFTTEERSQARWLRHFFDVGNCLPLPSALVRRAQLAASGGFRASLVQLGDFDLWIRLAALGQFRLLPEALTRIRIVANANLSAPRPPNVRRSQLEHAVVLERYLEKPLLEMFDKVFGDISNASSPGGRKVALAQRAVARGSVGVSFADRAIAGVLDNPLERADAVAEHGSGFIHEFLARRGGWAFVQQDAGNREC